MKLRTKKYEIYCDNIKYNCLVEILKKISFYKEEEKNPRGWTYFVMPEGKVKIRLSDPKPDEGKKIDSEALVMMEIIRTTRKEPRYIHNLIKKLNVSKGDIIHYPSFTLKDVIESHFI